VTNPPGLRRVGEHVHWLGARAVRALRHRARRVAHRVYFDDLIAETDNFADVRWLGRPIWQNVLDLWTLQEAIAEIRPALLIESGTNRGGSALFYAHLFDLLGRGRVITVDITRMHDLEHPRVDFLVGSSLDDHVLDRIRGAARCAGGPVMVILDSDHSAAHVERELAAYSNLVTSGSLLLVQDGIIDVLPRFAHARPGPLPAVERFLAAHAEFEVDPRWDRRFLVTHHPSGWLRRR
jgi:cephalosporin hydroxylase